MTLPQFRPIFKARYGGGASSLIAATRSSSSRNGLELSVSRRTVERSASSSEGDAASACVVPDADRTWRSSRSSCSSAERDSAEHAAYIHRESRRLVALALTLSACGARDRAEQAESTPSPRGSQPPSAHGLGQLCGRHRPMDAGARIWAANIPLPDGSSGMLVGLRSAGRLPPHGIVLMVGAAAESCPSRPAEVDVVLTGGYEGQPAPNVATGQPAPAVTGVVFTPRRGSGSTSRTSRAERGESRARIGRARTRARAWLRPRVGTYRDEKLV